MSCFVSQEGCKAANRGKYIPGQEAFAFLQQGDTDLILKYSVLFSVSLMAGNFSTEHPHDSW